MPKPLAAPQAKRAKPYVTAIRANPGATSQKMPSRSSSPRLPAPPRRPLSSTVILPNHLRAVGVDTVSGRAGVSKRTLYNRFGGKDGLVAEYLRRRDERWKAYLQGLVKDEPRARLLAVFEAYGEWLVGGDFRGCAFANAVAEIPDPAHPALAVARLHKEGVREYMTTVAREAGFEEPGELAERLLLLLEGAAATAAMRRSSEPLDVARSVAVELMDARSR